MTCLLSDKPRRWINAIKLGASASASASRKTGSRRPLSLINEDCLLEIIAHLAPLDILSLKQTCQSLRALCSLRAAWLHAAHVLIAQSSLVLPPSYASHPSTLGNVPAHILEASVLRAARMYYLLSPRPESTTCLRPRRQTCIKLPPLRVARYKGPLKTRPVYEHYPLSGDFKMLGEESNIVLIMSEEWIFLWDYGQGRECTGARTEGWLDRIPLQKTDFVSAYAVECSANKEVVRFAFCLCKRTGTSLLITYDIHLTRVQGALFSPVSSCDAPSPLTRLNITTNGLVLGVMEHAEPSGALMLYDWKTGAKRIFQSTTSAQPWRLILVPQYFALCSFDSFHNAFVLHLIPESALVDSMSLDNTAQTISIPPPATTYVLPPCTTQAASDLTYLPLSRTLSFAFLSQEVPTGISSIHTHQLRINIPPNPQPTHLPPPDPTLPTSQPPLETPYLELLGSTTGPRMTQFSQGCLLSSGHSMWTEVSAEILLKPYFKLRFSLSPLHAAIPPEQGGLRLSGAGIPLSSPQSIARELKWPSKLQADKIVGLDVNERTGKVFVGLSTGVVWILEYFR